MSNWRYITRSACLSPMKCWLGPANLLRDPMLLTWYAHAQGRSLKQTILDFRYDLYCTNCKRNSCRDLYLSLYMYSGVRIRFKYNCLSNQTACQFKYLRSGVRITSKKTVCDKITLGGIFRQRPAKFPMSQCCSVGCMTYLIMSMCIVKLCRAFFLPSHTQNSRCYIVFQTVP